MQPPGQNTLPSWVPGVDQPLLPLPCGQESVEIILQQWAFTAHDMPRGLLLSSMRPHLFINQALQRARKVLTHHNVS